MSLFRLGAFVVASAFMAANIFAAAEKDIVDTAVEAGSFKTLAAALKAADLIETLKGKGPFTVFAPTDEAFAKLPEGTVETLLKPENKAKLAAILTYHVVAGKVEAKDAVKLKSAKTVNGASQQLRSNSKRLGFNKRSSEKSGLLFLIEDDGAITCKENAIFAK
ncbi:fasciclin domain-containing protein [bacterium]|nr:fasciclin domain-containing protein [bacterium]